MPQPFDFFTGATIENKLAVVFSWYVDFDDSGDHIAGLSNLIESIPRILSGGEGVDWFTVFDALGTCPARAGDAELEAIYKAADARVNVEE